MQRPDDVCSRHVLKSEFCYPSKFKSPVGDVSGSLSLSLSLSCDWERERGSISSPAAHHTIRYLLTLKGTMLYLCSMLVCTLSFIHDMLLLCSNSHVRTVHTWYLWVDRGTRRKKNIIWETLCGYVLCHSTYAEGVKWREVLEYCSIYTPQFKNYVAILFFQFGALTL